MAVPRRRNNPQGTPAPYSADNSGGSNLGPTNQTLITTVQQRIDDLKKENPDVPAGTPIPVDLVTASGSGLDPDISVAGAYYQIPRIAKARGMTQEAVRSIVDAAHHRALPGHLWRATCQRARGQPGAGWRTAQQVARALYGDDKQVRVCTNMRRWDDRSRSLGRWARHKLLDMA